jgi:hypothetical protein
MQRKQIKKFIFKINEVYWIFLHTNDFDILFWIFIEQNNENKTFCRIYSKRHFFLGFILVPMGHLKSFAKSSLFERVPKTRKFDGEWKSP